MWDVAIVGGGPIGCFCAEKLAKSGLEVAILEEHEEIGHPMCCAGIVGAEGLKEVGLDLKNWTLEELKRATFYPPSGEPVSLTRGETEAYVIDRAAFDRDLAERAVRAGAKIFLKSRCKDVSFKENEVRLKTQIHSSTYDIDTPTNGANLNTVRARIIVGADGANSLVGRKAGLVRETSVINCTQAEAMADVDKNTAELYFGNKFSSGFFAWIVPAGGVSRIGLGTGQRGSTRRFLNFIKKHPIVHDKVSKKFFSLTTGLIPRHPARNIHGERVVLMGDAAGQNKPLTGGGIYIGLSCAKLAAEVVEKALEDGPSARNLSQYKRVVEEKFGPEFELGIRARNIVQRMSDDDLNEAFKILRKPKVHDLVLEHMDFDHHADIVEAMIKEGPSIMRSVGVGSLIRYLRWLTDF